MKSTFTSIEMALDAGTLLLMANIASHLEPLIVEVAAELLQPSIVLFKPYFVMPIDASMMNPLFCLQTDYGSSQVRTKEAVRNSHSEFVLVKFTSPLMINNVFASIAKPRSIFRHVIVLIKISTVACWVNYNHAKITLIQGVVVFTLF
jgi:hypothetical protein